MRSNFRFSEEPDLPLRACTHKSTLASSGWSMSALPPEADIRQRIEHVCFVPIADMTTQCLDSPTRRRGSTLTHVGLAS